MTNLLQSSAAFLIDTLNSTSVAGRTVRYERGGETLVAELAGVCAMIEYEVIDTDGVMTSLTSFDWTFEASDMEVNGAIVEPARGDRIIETINSTEVSYEPLPLGTKPASESLDTSGVILLVHTKKVKVVSGDE